MILAGQWFGVFFVLQFLGAKLVPGFFYESRVKKYSLTGLQMFFITTIAYLAAFKFLNFSLFPLIQHFWSFFSVVNIFSLVFSVYLFVIGKINKAPNFKNTSFLPDFLFEFWCGVEHNPTILGVDLKMFFYQPSLLGMLLFHFAFAEYQYRTYGELNYQTILYVVFWWLYLLSHYIKEEFMITTWDIIEEHFGFMLVWGDMIYVPFWYSVVGWWIADSTKRQKWQTYELVALVIFHLAAHLVFRTSNWQKHSFKKFGKKAIIWGSEPKLLEDKLLISGWWGIGRHLNYTGEICTYLSFSLCSGASSPIAYLLPFSLLILLGQRAWRDDQRCSEKYGTLWNKYCKIAKFKMIPFLY